MNDRDILREDRLTRTQTFGRANAADFAAGSKAPALFANITQILLDLAAAKIGQVPGRASKAALLDALWLDYKNIARTSRSIGASALGGSIVDYAVPADFTEALIKIQAEKLLSLLEDNTAPVGGDTPEQLAAKAARRALFLEWEIQADFVEDLRSDYDALIAANQLNQAENQDGVENTAAIGVLLLSGGQTVSDLDTIMQNKYARQPEKLRAWESASRVHRSPVRKKDAATPTTTA